MTSKLQIFLPIIVPLLVIPTLAPDLTYKEYAKASEIWKRGRRARRKQPRHHSAAKQRDELAALLLRSQFCLI